MKSTTQYSVNGQTMDVGDDEYDQFMLESEQRGYAPEAIHTYFIGDEEVQVPESELESFFAASKERGYEPREVRRLTMDDGNEFTVDPYAFEQVAQARRQGFDVSRSMMKKAGIPEQYAKSKEQRNWLAQRFAERFFADQITDEERAKMMGVGDGDIEIDETAGVRQELPPPEQGSPTLAGIKGAVTGLGEGFVDALESGKRRLEGLLLPEGSLASEMAAGGGAVAGKMIKGVASVVPNALGAAERITGSETIGNLREKAQGLADSIDTETDPLVTGLGEGVDNLMNTVREKSTDVVASVASYAIPGVAEVDVAANAINKFFEALKKAEDSGVEHDKAVNMAIADAGLEGAKGWILRGAAKGTKSAKGLWNALVEGGKATAKMSVLRGAQSVVEQGEEGADNPSLKRTVWDMGKEAANMALFEAVSRGARGIAGKTFAEGPSKREIANAEQKRIEREEKEAKRAEAEERYESKLSDEAMNDIDQTIAKQVDAETIPSWKHAEEVKRRAIEKLGKRENGESHEAVEQAVIEAADEVNARLNTTERVESAALERRQAEAKFKANEAKTKRGEKAVADYEAEEEASRKAEQERKGAAINADLDAQRESYDRRKKDIEVAFARGDTEAVKELLEEQKRELEEYERQEAERKRREAEEEANAPEVGEEEARLEAEQKASREANTPVEGEESWDDYNAWLKKQGRKDTAKNWNKFVAEHDLDPNLKKDTKDEAGYNAFREAIEKRRAGVEEPKPEKREPYDAKAQAEAEEMGSRIENQFPRGVGASEEQRAEGAASVKAQERRKNKERLDAINKKEAAAKAEEGRQLAEGAKPIEEQAERMRKANEKRLEEHSIRNEEGHRNAAERRETPEERAQREYDEKMTAYEEARAKRELEKKKYGKAKTPLPEKPAEPVAEKTAEPAKPTHEAAPAEQAPAPKAEPPKPEPSKSQRIAPVNITETKSRANMSVADAKKAVADYFNASEEARAQMSISDAIRALHEDSPTANIASIIDELIPEEAAKKMKLVEIERIREYARTIVGNPSSRLIADGHFGGRQKQNGEGKRFEAERKAALKPLDDALVEIANGNEGGAKVWGDKERSRFNELLAKGKLTKGEQDELAILVGGPSKTYSVKTGEVANQIEVPLGATGKLKVARSARDIIFARQRLHERYGKEASKKYYEIDETPQDTKLNDPDFITWAKKQARVPSDKARRDYDAQRIQGLGNVVKNWIKGVKIINHDSHAEIPNGARMAAGEGVKTSPVAAAIKDGSTSTRGVSGGSTSVTLTRENAEPVRKFAESIPKSGAKSPVEFLGGLKKSLGVKGEELGKTNYFDITTEDGGVLSVGSLRLSDHRANAKNNIDAGNTADSKIGVVIKMKETPFRSSPNVDYTEFVYFPDKLTAERQAQIATAVSEWIKTGKYNGPKADLVNVSVNKNIRNLYSKDGNVVGWYDKATKEVHTLPGADAVTVAHELGWHATYDHAEQLAANGDRTLLDKLTKYAEDAKNIVVDPATGQTLEQLITARYGQRGVTDPTALLDEIGAARYTMDNIAKIENAAARRQAAKWYERTWNAVTDTCKSLLTKLGFNKANLDGIGAMQPDQVVSLLADQMLAGKSLGKSERTTIDMGRDEKFGEKYMRKIKDYLNPVKELEKDAGKSVSDSAYTKMRNLPGKVQSAINEAEHFEKRVTDACKEAGINIADLNEYMYAKAAAQRNAKVFRNTGRLDGSAMSLADINRVLGKYQASPKFAEFERIRQEVLAFQKRGFDKRVRAGLVSQQTAADLLRDEPDHVPMKSRFAEDGEHTGFDANTTFGHAEWHNAEGRTNVGDGPLGWILQEYVDAVARSAENMARRELLSTIIAHPEVGTVRKLNPGESTDEVRRNGAPGNPNVIVVKANGDNYRIEFNGKRGEAIAAAMTGRNIVRPPEAVQKAMRWWSSTATAWSPTFAARNFIADTVDVFAVNIGEHGLIKGGARNAQHVATAFKLIPEIRNYVKTGTTNDPILREAIDAGVLMGGGVRSRAWSEPSDALKTLKTDIKNGKNKVRGVTRTLFGWVDTLNQTAELMNRMADYRIQRQNGMSKNEAALHAREVTVDFNQKGEISPVTNTLYMFSNSTLGSTMRLVRAIGGKHGGQLVAGTFALGVIEGIAEVIANGDDEDGKNMNEYTRANSVYFRNGSDIVRIPLHNSPISVIKYAGNCAVRMLAGQIKPGDAAEKIGGEAASMITHFAGLGDIGTNKLAGVWPTIVQPFVQAYMNRDFADRPIEKPTYSEVQPKSDNGRNHTPETYKDIAKGLNELTGGNAGRKGKLDFSPEMIKHFAESVGKNALRDAMNAENLVETVIKIGSDMADGKGFVKSVSGNTDRRNIPVVRDYYRTTGGNDDRFFKAKNAFQADKKELAKMRDSWTPEERRAYMEKHPHLRTNGAKSTIIDRWVNGFTSDGIHRPGINDLRRMENGEFRDSHGKWHVRKTPPTDEQVEKWRQRRMELQAKVIEKMGL